MERLTKTMLETLLRVVAEVCGVTPADITGTSRTSQNVIPRQVFCYIANRYLDLHPASIALVTGRNRTTVIHSIRAIEGLLEVGDAATGRIVNDIKSKLYHDKTSPLLPHLQGAPLAQGDNDTH